MYWTFRVGTQAPPYSGVRTPTGIDDVAIWFDAQEGLHVTSSNGVYRWESKVNGYFVEQTGSSNLPTFRPNDINGKHSVGFSISGPKYLYARKGTAGQPALNQGLVTFPTGTQAQTHIIVSKEISADKFGNDRAYYGWGSTISGDAVETSFVSAGDGRLILNSVNGVYSQQFVEVAGQVSIADDEYHILVCTVNPTNKDKEEGQGAQTFYRQIWRRDGQTTTVLNYSNHFDQFAPMEEFWIGGRQRTNSFCSVDIAEIMVYDRELSITEIEKVEDYLFDKYFSPGDLDGLIEWFKPGEGVQT